MLKLFVWIWCALLVSVHCKPQLKLLHVVFAHKLYAPFRDVSGVNGTQFPRNLTYEYFNTAASEIPNAGKLNMYKFGAYLRRTYDSFLGPNYTERASKMRTTEYPLSILSGQLVNAALWPPKGSQKWHQTLQWQPVPADYVRVREDTLLMGMHCPSFRAELQNSPGLKKLHEAAKKRHSLLFGYLSNHTGAKIETISEIALLYASLETKADLNETLPKWARDVFPHGSMYNASVEVYDLLTETPLQKQLNGGTLLKEISGTTLRYIQGVVPSERRIMLYSGNDRNVAGLLKTMGIWSPHIPNEAAAVIFEIYHDNSTNAHYVKVKYYTGTDGTTIPLKLRNCTDMCPMKKFLSTFYELMPQNEELLCQWRVPKYFFNATAPTRVETRTETTPRRSGSTSCRPETVLVVSLLTILFSALR